VIEVAGTRYELVPKTPTNDTRGFSQIAIDELGYFQEIPNSSAPAIILGRPLNDSGQQLNVRHDDRGLEIASLAGSSNLPFWSGPVPYKILRQATPTSDEPYQLPEGVAIDLRASGVGINDYFYWADENDNSLGVIIMFTPEGRVSRVQYSQSPPITEQPFDQPVADNIYLLLGKRENVPAPPVEDDISLSTADWNAATDE
jgi:hypothetical protein